MAARMENKNRGPSNDYQIRIFTRFAKKGIPATETIQKLVNDFRTTRKSLNDVKKHASAILKLADEEEFKDNRKAAKIGNSVKHMYIVLSHFMDELEKRCDKADMEEFSDLINSDAFRTFLLVASDACNKGEDSGFIERYAVLREALVPLAEKYRIKILAYKDIPEEAGVMMERELISRNDVMQHLEANVNVGIDEDVKKLLKLPSKLYMEKGTGYIAFSDKADMNTITSIKKIFDEVGTYPPEYKVPEDAGYGILLAEVGSHGYIWLLDNSRKIAVKADIYSLNSEERGWEKFKNELNKILKEARKLKKGEKAIIFSDRGIVRKFVVD